MAEEFPIESAHVIEYEKDHDRLSEAIDMHLGAARERKWTRALAWFRNAAFLAGQHLDNFRYAQGQFTQSAVVIPSRFQDVMSPHMVDNHVLRIYQANVAELTGMNPYPVVEPASMSPDDQDLSRIAELAIKVMWEKPLRAPQKLRMGVGYLGVTGTMAMEPYFGELDTLEERMKLEMADVPDLVSGGTEKVPVETDKVEWVRKRGLRMRAWSGFHIDPNPDATEDPESLTWICRTTFEDVHLMKRMFHRNEPGYHWHHIKDIGPEECTNDALWHWEQLKDLQHSPTSDMAGALDRGTRRSLANCTRVRMIDCRPNLEFPMGRTIVQIGGKIAYDGPSRTWSESYPERWTPMLIARWWTMPGQFWGYPLISALVPLQKRINALDALIRLSRQHMGIGAWLLPKACGVPEGFIGPVPGQNVPYKFGPRGEKPERVPFQPLTADIFEERAMMVASMERIGGIASAQLSSSPSALRSGTMLDFSQRQALQSKSALMLDFEAFVGDIAQAILQEVARNMADDPELRRRITVAARELGDLAIDRYAKLDLRDNVRVQIDLRSQMLQTPEAKKEAAAIFLQFGGQNMSASERARIAVAMGIDELEGQVSAQYKRARRMVERILQGDPSAAVVLDGVDDPGLFAEVVRDAMLSERAMTAPLEAKQALQALLDAYSEKVQNAMQNMARQVAMETQNSNGVANQVQPGQTGG